MHTDAREFTHTWTGNCPQTPTECVKGNFPNPAEYQCILIYTPKHMCRGVWVLFEPVSLWHSWQMLNVKA